MLQRGCGVRSEKAFYLTGTLGSSGLLPAQWTFGTHFLRSVNCSVSAPDRGQVLDVNIPATLASGRLARGLCAGFDHPVADELYQRLSDRIVGRIGIADHVGERYTPLRYYNEAMFFGASLRISSTIVEQIVDMCGGNIMFPALMSMKLPIFMQIEEVDDFLFSLGSKRDNAHLETRPSWVEDSFGLFNDASVGESSYMINVFQAIEKAGWRKVRDVCGQLSIMQSEVPFCTVLVNEIQYTGLGTKGSHPIEADNPYVRWVYADEQLQQEIDKEES